MFKKYIIFIVLIIFIFIIIICSNKNKELFNIQNVKSNIFFTLENKSGLNLTFMNNNFYLTDKYPFIFEGLLEDNGLYRLKNPYSNYDFVLNYNSTNTSESEIILQSNKEIEQNQNTIQNIFNLSNNNIYLDPINKIILSNDNSGNIVYLTNLIDGSSVEWNYNLDNSTKFNVKKLYSI